MPFQTESFMEIIDRFQIILLKHYHFSKVGNHEAAELAWGQAQDLKIAADLYMYECMTGKRRPLLRPKLRFHDHKKIEGKWAEKKAEIEEPNSLIECIALLSLIHAKYWDNQTRLNNLKGLIDRSEGLPDKTQLEAEFCKAQRQQDIFNQVRSDLIDLGNEFFLDITEKGATQ